MNVYICRITWLHKDGHKIISVEANNENHAKRKLRIIYIGKKGFKIIDISKLS